MSNDWTPNFLTKKEKQKYIRYIAQIDQYKSAKKRFNQELKLISRAKKKYNKAKEDFFSYRREIWNNSYDRIGEERTSAKAKEKTRELKSMPTE